MIPYRNRLIKNEKAIIKYKHRLVKIFCVSLGLWKCGNELGGRKQDVKEITLEVALEQTKDFEKEVEFHFIDDFGDDRFKVTDFDDESIYSCTVVQFESLKRKNKDFV